MSLIIMCKRRMAALQITAAVDKAGLDWQISCANAIAFQERVKNEQPRFAIITSDNTDNLSLFTNIRSGSPQTLILLCLLSDDILTKELSATIDSVEIDSLCAFDELSDCLITLKTGQFYHSRLLYVQSSHKSQESLLGWHELTLTERRVANGIANGKNGLQIAVALFVCEKTVNNHKLKISQKLGVCGGPGSLTKFILSNLNNIPMVLE